MRVIAIRPYRKFEVIEIADDLKALQDYVGGFIEAVTIAGGSAAVICNEEGRIKDMPYNHTIGGISFYGPVLIVGVDGEDFCSIEKHHPVCQSAHPDCICNTCKHDCSYMRYIKDDYNPCCDRKGHRKVCDGKTCPDYREEERENAAPPPRDHQ